MINAAPEEKRAIKEAAVNNSVNFAASVSVKNGAMTFYQTSIGTMALVHEQTKCCNLL